MKRYQTDVAVIAAGPAGLAAAIQAAEQGAGVLVLEKAAQAGGAANLGMGLLGIGTRQQQRQMLEVSVEKAFGMFMEYTHYNVDARLVRRYFAQSADTIRWLEEMGVEFEGAYRYFPRSEATWHIVKTEKPIGPAAAKHMLERMKTRAEELGAVFLMKTPAKRLLKRSGRVCGVLAETAEGEQVEVSCRAAVICTGGAGADAELIRQETGFVHGRDLFSFAVKGLTGDGLRMAWEAGADRMPVRIEMAASLEGTGGLPESVSNVFLQPNLLVNRHGKRVMNEEHMQNSTFLSNVAAHQKDRVCFSMVDSSIVEHYRSCGVDHVSMVRPNPDVSDFWDGMKAAERRNGNSVCAADTLEELAEKLGVEPAGLLATVEQYNRFCQGTDEEFFKPKRFLRPLLKPPYCGARVRPGGYGTVGGIRINENCEACGPDFEPVPGLYAAGADACNIYEDSYMFLLPGNSMGFAVNTGRIAGSSAAEWIKNRKDEEV